MTIQTDPWNAAMEEDVVLAVHDFPSALLMRAAMVLRLNVSKVYATKHGLTLPEWRIVGNLWGTSYLPLSLLRRITNLDKAQATRVLQGLQTRGLVVLSASDNHSAHRNVALTEEGRLLAARVFPEALAEQRRLLAELTPEERRITYQVLRKLMAACGVELTSHEVAMMKREEFEQKEG